MFQEAVGAIQERSRFNTEDLCRYTQDLCLGWLNALLGNDKAVAPWLGEGDITEQRLVVMTQPFAYIIYGRCLLLRRDWRRLLGACQHMQALSSIFPNLFGQLYAKLYMAQALCALGQRSEAVSALHEALDMALPDQVYLPFAENYAGIRDLLSALVLPERGRSWSVSQRWRNGWTVRSPGSGRKSRPYAPGAGDLRVDQKRHHQP